MILYIENKGYFDVVLDKKKVGKILVKNGTYQYFPKGQKTGGEVFNNLRDCQKSLGCDEISYEEI
jgi:hypothetical protein